MMSMDSNLAEFRARIDKLELTKAQREFCDDACLKRYMVAYKDLNLALTKLQSTLEWRKEYGVDEITLKDVESEAIAGGTYTNGFDNQNRPIIYIKKKEHVSDPWKGVKLVVYTLEQAIKSMPKGVEQWVIVFDMEKYSRANATPFAVSRMTLDIFANHYPERLANAYFTYNPWVYSVFWTMISPFIDVKTRSKIHILGTDFDKLKEIVDDDSLEKKYGGALDYTFDFVNHYS